MWPLEAGDLSELSRELYLWCRGPGLVQEARELWREWRLPEVQE